MMSRKASIRSSLRLSVVWAMGVSQHPGLDWMALGVVGVEQSFWRYPLDHLGQLPSKVHGILHTEVEALATHR